jgi:hypothetical protein
MFDSIAQEFEILDEGTEWGSLYNFPILFAKSDKSSVTFRKSRRIGNHILGKFLVVLPRFGGVDA